MDGLTIFIIVCGIISIPGYIYYFFTQSGRKTLQENEERKKKKKKKKKLFKELWLY